jgi:holo-[acyl-carrier protein] synthase
MPRCRSLASEVERLQAALAGALAGLAGRDQTPQSCRGPLSVGLDVLEVGEVALSLAAQPERYARRVYTDAELCECRSSCGTLDPFALAQRFAAKEATLKAFRVLDECIPWHSISVRCDNLGKPSLELTGAAAALADLRGFGELEVSLIRVGGLAASVVVARSQTC